MPLSTTWPSPSAAGAKRVRTSLRRLEAGERCWGAECLLRGFGAALLGLCATAFWWLHRALAGAQGPGALDIAVAVLGVAALGLGLAFAFEGPALFRLLPVPGRYFDFTS